MAVYLGNQIIGLNNITGDSGSSSGDSSSSSSITVSPLNITANGTYTAPDGTAYSPVSVDIGMTPALRIDAELVKTWSYDEKAVEDWNLTIPAYSTSAQTLQATQDLTPTYTMDITNYNWYLIERFVAIPEYSITTVGKGRVEYNIGIGSYELLEIPKDSIYGIFNPNLKYASDLRGWYSTGTNYRSIYYSSGTALSVYATSTYTTGQTITAPGYSSGVVTIKTPAYSLRGSTSYFVNTYFNAITDIRYQFIAELYRVPKDVVSTNGWILGQQTMKIIDCINSTNHTLT